MDCIEEYKDAYARGAMWGGRGWEELDSLQVEEAVDASARSPVPVL